MSAEALVWFKSSYSGSEGGQCLEVAATPQAIHVRDSKQQPAEEHTLRLSPATWAAFTASLR
ncbi:MULTISPECIES: DUF397 domain-containing protein [unclassified Streptomyces]|uniref:DUF397 domain-containing protein n=1 Tax=unclassified Streptomyces TaxID=2593676 RepID=UPI0036C5A280